MEPQAPLMEPQAPLSPTLIRSKLLEVYQQSRRKYTEEHQFEHERRAAEARALGRSQVLRPKSPLASPAYSSATARAAAGRRAQRPGSAGACLHRLPPRRRSRRGGNVA